MTAKPGKDHTQASSYRPISLPCIPKLFEGTFCAIFLDVAQAFEKVLHKGLLHKIYKTLPIQCYNILESYV